MSLKQFFIILVLSHLVAAEVSAQSATKFTIPGSAVTASTYDTVNNAVPANAVDGSLSTRWAGQGDGAYITFDLGATQDVWYMRIAWYQGDTRTTTFDVLASTSSSGPWTTLLNRKVSSGTTTNFETYNFTDTEARYIRIVGHGNSSGNGWNSITEVELWGAAGTSNQVAAPTFSPPAGTYSSAQTVTLSSATSGASIRYTMDGSTPSSSTGTLYSGPVTINATTTLKALAYLSGMTDSSVTSGTYTINTSGGLEAKFTIPGSAVTASTYDTVNNAVPANAVDGNLSTRWAGQGDGAYITFDLGATQDVRYMKIAWYQGNTRTTTFDVLASTLSSGPWTALLNRKVSSGTTTNFETYDFTDTNARYIRIVGHGNSSGNGWNSITEVEIWGIAGTSNQVAAPTFSPPAGTYSSAQTVTISSATSGASIRYTMDGSTPSSSTGTLYSGPVTISATTILKAIAYKSGMIDSAVISGVYTIGGLNPNAPPSENFDLSHWKLTLPIDGNDEGTTADEVSTSTLNNGYELDGVFYTDPNTGGMVFRSPNIGATTSTNTKYTRTELREMLAPDGSAHAKENNWVLSTSSSSAKSAAGGIDGTLTATLSVDRVSTTGDSGNIGSVIIGQIHADGCDCGEIIRLYYHKRPSDTRGAIYFGHDTPSNATTTWHAIIGNRDNLNPSNGILLGEKFSYEIKVVGQFLTIKVTPENRPTMTATLNIESGYNDISQYFKAGAYNQNNTGTTDDYVQVTFYSLTHTHP